MSKVFLRSSQDGRGNKVRFRSKPIYYKSSEGESLDILGKSLDINEWIKDNIKKPEYFNDIYNLLIDWSLYENGWFIKSYNNKQLYNYKCQIGVNYTPIIALSYLK